MFYDDNRIGNADEVVSRTLDGLTYQTESLTVNLVPIIVLLFILYFARIFTLFGGDFDDFMDLTMNGLIGDTMSSYDALDATYGPPLSGGYAAPQNGGYNAPQQTGYNAPQTSYNAQPSYNANGGGGRVDFNIPVNNQVETFDPTAVRNDASLTPEEVALYNQLLLANNYMYLEQMNNQRRRRRKRSSK